MAPLRASKVETVKTSSKKASEEDAFTDGPDVAPSTGEVKALLETLTSDTEIAEMKLKMGSFQLTVRRNVGVPAAAAAPAHAAHAAPAVAYAPAPTLAPALALAPVPYRSMDEESADESVDENLLYCYASKVGVFRRGRYAAGKRVGKSNVANTGDQVKKGQTLGYIEQLGTFVEVKAPQGGEIVEYKADEGDPVDYGQAVVALAPYFGVAEAGVTEYR